jgi:hypothetical protein
VRKRSDEGYTPKVEIYDRTNRRYVVKFDPRGARERNSAAERIGTLIMHAAGYNVVHNTIVTVKRQDLVVDEKSYYYDPVGKRQTLTDRHIDDFLMTLDPMPDGSYRGNASLFLDGGIGPFKFTGLRPDDPNDRIPHQMRRELRGLRVIGSWINHVDIKDDQAIDTYNPAGGQNFVKHYLLDFSATLGAYEWPSAPFRVGHEFMFDASTMSKSFFSLGLWKPEWESQPDPSFREIGYFEAELFEPAKWKPSFPNIAFEQMEGGDAYWGTRIVTAFPKDLIERIVQDGEFQNRAAAQYVVDVLLKRQKKIGEYWLNRITPVEEPTLSGARLQFRDLAVDRG